jgi:hypothetical protein
VKRPGLICNNVSHSSVSIPELHRVVTLVLLAKGSGFRAWHCVHRMLHENKSFLNIDILKKNTLTCVNGTVNMLKIHAVQPNIKIVYEV